MRILRQLESLIDQMPLWGQILVGAFLVAYSIASVYGRINPSFGKKVFSKIPESEIRSNKAHIVGYTIIPVIVMLGYLFLLWTKHFVG